MRRLPSLFPWLVVAALLEWLVGRTFTRAAIHIPKSPLFIDAYRAVHAGSQVVATFAGLLALAAVAWIIHHERRQRQSLWLPLALAARATLSVLFLFILAPPWLALTGHLLTLLIVALLAWRVAGAPGPGPAQAGWFAGALTLLAALIYQIGPLVYRILGWPGPPAFGTALFNLGELLVVVSLFILWWAHGRRAPLRAWLIGGIPALFFAASYLAMPSMTAILAVWSTGLTLFLPWPLYALALWLAGVTTFAALRRGEPAGWAVPLLAAAGYAPQLSSHLLFALIALWLLSSSLPQPVSFAPGRASSWQVQTS